MYTVHTFHSHAFIKLPTIHNGTATSYTVIIRILQDSCLDLYQDESSSLNN